MKFSSILLDTTIFRIGLKGDASSAIQWRYRSSDSNRNGRCKSPIRWVIILNGVAYSCCVTEPRNKFWCECREWWCILKPLVLVRLCIWEELYGQRIHTRLFRLSARCCRNGIELSGLTKKEGILWAEHFRSSVGLLIMEICWSNITCFGKFSLEFDRMKRTYLAALFRTVFLGYRCGYGYCFLVLKLIQPVQKINSVHTWPKLTCELIFFSDLSSPSSPIFKLRDSSYKILSVAIKERNIIESHHHIGCLHPIQQIFYLRQRWCYPAFLQGEPPLAQVSVLPCCGGISMWKKRVWSESRFAVPEKIEQLLERCLIWSSWQKEFRHSR